MINQNKSTHQESANTPPLHEEERKCKILVVEDEKHLAHGLSFNLKKEGMFVDIAEDGEAAIEKWKSFDPDLIILDLMLPKMDGTEVLEMIRKESEKIPVLILSAKDQINDKVKGFSLGADDYLTKPFHLDELIHRVKRLLKQSQWYQEKNQENQQKVYTFGKNTIHMETYWVECANGEFRLTEQEMKLLKIFMASPEKIISKRTILKEGWGYNDEMETRTLDIFMTRLRKYFEDDYKGAKHFVSLRNKGIIFYPNPQAKN